MIDPDINEQMARYAPSQRPPRFDRLATDIMAAGPYRPVEVRDPIADSIVDDRQDTLAASLLEASKTNPDEAARALQLARDNNVGTDIALRNMNALAQQARIAQVQDLELPKRNPILSRMLEDREFARVAQDDIKNLNDTGSVFRDFVTGNFGSFSTLGELATGATRARLTTKRGQLSVEAMTRDLTPFEEQELVTIEKELEKVSEIGFLRGAAEQVSYLYESVPYIVGGVAKGAVAGAVAGAAGGPLAELTVPAGTIIGSGFGAQYGIGEFTYVVEAGNAYRDMVVEGRDVIKQRLDAGEIDQAGYDQQMYEMESSARSIATGVGLANAVLEVGAVKLALAPFRAAFAPVLRQAFGGAIKDVTRREAFKILGFEFMKQVGGQGATELVQEVNIMIGEDLQRAYGSKLPTKMSTPEGREEVAQRLIDTFEHAVVGFTILGTFGPTAQYYSNVRRAESALQTRQFFSTLSEQAKAGNLMTRSPEMYQRVIAGYANGTDAETTYINGRELNSVLQQLAIPREEFANRFPDVARQLDQAMELDQDVTLPTAEFAAKMSTTNLGQALLQHVRVDPRAMSPKMAEEFLAQRPQLLQEAREMYQQKESADQEFVASGRRVEQAITADLEATGQYKNKADVRAVAQVARDMYTALAKRTNTTPEAVYEQYRNRVQLAPAQAAQAQALEQANQFTPEGQRRLDTPEFREWFRESKIVKERGEPRVVYHGTDVIGGFTQFVVGPVGEYGRGIYFTTSPETASNYAGTQIGAQVIPAYVSISKPLIANKATFYTDVAAAFGQTRKQFMENAMIASREDGTPLEDYITDTLRASGYDGVVVNVAPDEQFIVAFDPTQVKSPNNLGTWSRTSPNILRQSAMPMRLMAVHNLSADNLAFAEQMGGLAVPSIGVITEERGGVEGFGEITLIGTQEMADPATSRVFSSDAYSARFPRAEWPKVSSAKADKFVSQLRDVAKRFGDDRIIDQTFDAMVNSPDAQKVVGYWLRSMPVGALFLSEKGIDIAPTMRERKTLSGLSWEAIDKLRPAYEAVDQQVAYDEMENSTEYRNLQDQYATAIRAQYASVREDLGDATIERWATGFTPTTLQRLSRDMGQAERQTVDDTATRSAVDAAMEPFIAEFKSWVDTKVRKQFGDPFIRIGRSRKPYTLSNIVDVMTSTKVRGEEKGMTFGAGAARAEAATEFVDLEQMREAAKSAIVEPDEYSKAAKKSDAQLSAYRDAVIEYTTLTDWRGKSDTWAALDGSMRALATYGSRKRRDAAAMRRVLAKEGFASNRMPNELIEQAMDAAEALFNAPVPYFEAKPQRAVRIGEFAGAVIPSNATQETRDILDRNGVRYMTYLAGDEQDRQRAVREMARSPEAAGQTLFQAARGLARGWFDPITFITTLTSQADQTTFLHELAHFYLSVLMDVATTANPPAEITADLDNLFQWFGIDGATQEDRFNNWLNLSFEQQRKYHEQFAYSFEIYLFENKAPSIELRGAFARFASWFRQVYRNIRDELNAIYREQFGTDLPILTPEIRSVMDRMLADEDQIARQAAVNDVKAYYQTQEESGMDDATWLAYQMMAQETIDEAVAELTAKSLRNMQWLDNAKSAYIKNLQKKNAALRAEVREEVEAELELQRQYRTMQYLKRGVLVDVNGGEQAVQGPHKLDSAELKQSYDSLPESQRPNYLLLGTGRYGMIGKDGVSAEVVANLFGYGSGDEMIRDLLATKPLKDAIEERTDAVMLERYGDLQDPKSMERAANAALQNDARARFLAVELRNEAKATQPARFFVEAAKQAAEEFLANKKLKNLRPIEFVQAESRNAKDAQDALRMKTAPMKSGQAVYTSVYEAEIAAGVDEATAQATAQAARDAYQAEQTAKREAAFMARFGNVTPTEAIIRAKRAQLFNNQLARQGYDIQDQVRADVKYMRRVLRPENVAKMDASFVDQLQHLLTRFNLATMTQKQLEDHTNIVQWMVGQEKAGVVFDFAPGLINPNRATPYQNLTVQEFRDLVDAVKQIEYVGKNERKVRLAGEKVAYGIKRDQIVAAIRANWKGKVGIKRQPITPAERRMDAMKRYFYDHLKAASVARIMDGGQDGGPMWEYLIRSANEAGDMETTMRAKATKELTEILKPLFARGKMGGNGTFFPSINRSMNREARLVVALNMGNAGNIQRMLDGEGWTMEQVMPILNSMTEAELLAVQAVWDYLESFRPLVGAKERRINGQEPKWVEPQPMIVKSADGKSVTLRGGYYPIVYDRYASFRVDARKEQELAREQLRATFTAATTRRTHTKARVKQVIGQPIVYSLAGLYNGVNDVIHDLSWHEWLIQANRLMRDPIVLSAIRETYGPQAHALLKDWIDSNAEGERGANSGTEGIVNMMRHNISVTGLGFSVLSAASQITGFANSFVRVGGGDVTVGAKWVGRGIAAYTANPARASARVRESSEFMANRARTQWRELNEIRNQVQGESMFRRGLRANSYVLMTFMQGVVDIPTWMGAYEKAIDGGFDDETAIALADQAVIDSQGSGMLKDLAGVERGGPMMKLFTVFYSYMNVVYNQAAVSTMTAKSRAKYIADMLTLLTVPVVLNYGLRSALTPNAEDDEEGFEAIARDLIAEQLSYLMGTMVIVREAAFVSDIVAGKESPRRGYEGPAGLRLINETGRFVTQAKQGEFDRAFRKSLINMLGVMFGLPSAQINRTVDGLEAIGEEEVTGPEAALAPLTGVER